MKPQRLPVVVLISGRGSNLQALIEQTQGRESPIELRAVVSNNPSAPGLRRAQAAGIPTGIVDHRSFATREAFERA